MKDCLPSRLIRSLFGQGNILSCPKKNPSPEGTRTRILQAAFEEMYQHGYQGMRIESVLQKTGLAKGALYHHFKTKKHLAYAVVDELLHKTFLQIWLTVEDAEDPLEEICRILTAQCEQISYEEVVQGCPLNNLSQEMVGLDDGFKDRLSQICLTWTDLLASGLEKAQANGVMRRDLDARNTAAFIISSHQGVLGAAKCLQSKEMLDSLMGSLCHYIRYLKTP